MLVGDVLGSVIVPCVLGNVGVIGDLLAGLEVVEDLVAVDSLEAVPVVRVLLLVSGALDGILGELDDGEYLLILFVDIEVGGVIRTCRNVLIELVADRAAGEVGGAVAGVNLDVVLDGGADVDVVVAVEEQVNVHLIERILAVVDVVVADVERIMVGGVRACVGHDDAPLLVGSVEHALAPLQLLLHDFRLLVGRSNLAVQDDEDRVAVLKVTHGAVKLGVAGLCAGHIEALCEGNEVPVALHLVVACDRNGRVLRVVVMHDFEACFPFGGLVAVLGGVACGDHEVGVRANLERLVDRILEAHVVLNGLGLRVGVEDNLEILVVCGLRSGEGLFVAHELAAVADAVNVLSGRGQAGDLNAVSSLFLVACGYGLNIRGAGLALPLGSALYLVLDHGLGDARIGQPVEAEAALLGVRGDGDLVGVALYLAVVDVQNDGLCAVGRLGDGFLVGLDRDVVEHIAYLVGRQGSGVGIAGGLHGNSGIDLGGIVAVVQGSALDLVGGDDARGYLSLAVVGSGVECAGNDARAAYGVIDSREDRSVKAAQDRLLAAFAPVPNLAHIPAETFVGRLAGHFLSGNVLPLDGLLGRLVAGKLRAFPSDVAGDVGRCLVVELANDLVNVLHALDDALCGNAVLERLAGVEGACDAACVAYRAARRDGIDRAGCEAAGQIAAAVLNACDAARVIRRGNIGVDVAVLDMADDRAFALLQLAADTARGMRVGQIEALDLTGNGTAGDRAVVYAGQSADVLLTGYIAVEQSDILDIRLVVLIADIAEQTSIFLFIFNAKALDRVELAVERAGKALLFFGCDRLEALDAGHVDVGGQNIVSIARGAVFPLAREI